MASSTLAALLGEGFHVSTTVTEPESTRQPRTSSFSYDREKERAICNKAMFCLTICKFNENPTAIHPAAFPSR